MKLFRFIFLIFISVFVTSCRTTYITSAQSDYENRFRGATHNQIVSALGAPNRQTSDGNGGTILIYESTSAQSIATATNINYFNKTYTPGVNTTYHTSYVHFYIDSKSKCYRVKTNRTKQYSKFSTGKTIGCVLGFTLPILTGVILGLTVGRQ